MDPAVRLRYPCTLKQPEASSTAEDSANDHSSHNIFESKKGAKGEKSPNLTMAHPNKILLQESVSSGGLKKSTVSNPTLPSRLA
mmetsp:Transcript_3251/g.5399  ORF Transcript_3251/g.5399 Transcript_3251/m.5399 type:complete len:84 (-) Transcript_3251:1262-1513(-)